ncbi:MAG TPA: TatD family hydrolase [Patescibacteria group bacterium]|nr:TatD family hydrolase [Patescibacteria group bacterium]
MFDTHCHLQFQAFEGKVKEIIEEARRAGVYDFVVPGTDIETSQKAVEIAGSYKNVYAAVGIHPHHIYEIQSSKFKMQNNLEKLKLLLQQKKVVAVGEIGLDRHAYMKTKYKEYVITDEFILLQKELFVAQLRFAKEYQKSVIIHNREAKDEMLKILENHWDPFFSGKMVFHCCEPDGDLLDFAKKNNIFIGVDGDLTYRVDKQNFVRDVPLDLLVIETDAPFLTPAPIREGQRFPNRPAHLIHLRKMLADIYGKEERYIDEVTTKNAKELFQL